MKSFTSENLEFTKRSLEAKTSNCRFDAFHLKLGPSKLKNLHCFNPQTKLLKYNTPTPGATHTRRPLHIFFPTSSDSLRATLFVSPSEEILANQNSDSSAKPNLDPRNLPTRTTTTTTTTPTPIPLPMSSPPTKQDKGRTRVTPNGGRNGNEDDNKSSNKKEKEKEKDGKKDKDGKKIDPRGQYQKYHTGEGCCMGGPEQDIFLTTKVLFCLDLNNPIRKGAIWLVTWKYFDRFIMTIILGTLFIFLFFYFFLFFYILEYMYYYLRVFFIYVTNFLFVNNLYK